VRFVAATNRDIEAESTAGRFRQDLFFRLNGISLLIPPLRERIEEIEPFARMFIAAACAEVERTSPLVLSAAVLALLKEHQWPGNVRELRNVIERAVVLCVGDAIVPEHLPPSLLKAAESRRAALGVPDSGPSTLRSEIDALEKAKILETLERCDGNQSRAARMLGISRGTLLARLDTFGIARPRKGERPTEE
jgi:DNA-binding NtrC family response regulator